MQMRKNNTGNHISFHNF